MTNDKSTPKTEETRYGVTILLAGKRCRSHKDDGLLLSTTSRQEALARASDYADRYDARLVRLKRKAKVKGWRPVSEIPTGERRCFLVTDGKYVWSFPFDPRRGCRINAFGFDTATHWRELPRLP